MSTLVWVRNDLRFLDNPALVAACSINEQVYLVYIYNDHAVLPIGEASKVWLHHSLKAFLEEAKKRGFGCILRRGDPVYILKKLAQKNNIKRVFWNRSYEPYDIEMLANCKNELQNINIEAKSFIGNVLFEPWEISNQNNKPYVVFTAFWKACTRLAKKYTVLEDAVPKVHTANQVSTLSLEELELLPKIHWDKEITASWKFVEQAAHAALNSFLSNITSYDTSRNIPSTNGTSKLSPYLHFGEISVRYIWSQMHKKFRDALVEAGIETFLKEFGWREFNTYLLYHFPDMIHKPMREEFEYFPYEYDETLLKRWQKGQTGYPIVDAGMRELWYTGWMHNRVRMITGSFLVKHLLHHWKHGVDWFWNTLVDADTANNTGNWQWVAGCGADAAPYFRIFNPILQGEKFDPEGSYVRKWIPELQLLPTKYIHSPWNAPAEVLKKAKVHIGVNYPEPCIELSFGRDRALEAFKKMQEAKI